MALSFLILCYKSQINNKFNLFFIIIDHGLRINSEIEAKNSKKTI